ncbi:SDR family oxidoreductase [Chachezhania antarctica]|uniref:SDR family oxidoreductase n=1 Tax=Chachezhania antarctica TaxID=2340860 RepID=UPI0013CEA571|nr:SDR family NAD(P)-dependent oxidoreductase [Chachezhania antarctica]
MTTISGRTAFVTGAGSGLGLAIARSLAGRGANVMLADIDADRLKAAKDELLHIHDGIASLHCDVSDPEQVDAAAGATVERFGAAHIVVNNAGVAIGGAPGQIDLADWRWLIGINLMGVVHGVQSFLPILRRQGTGGHIVNTASIAGHIAMPGLAPYNASKYAVVGYSETLQRELAPEGIGVSVLCPGWVRTDIHNTGAKRPSLDSATETLDDMLATTPDGIPEVIANGIDPALVGDLTAEGIESGRFYLFTHPSMKPMTELRAAAIAEDYAACSADPRFRDA